MKKKLLVLMLVLAMALTLFAGCNSEETSQEKAGSSPEGGEKVLKFAQTSEPPALDPGKTTDTISSQIGQAIFEGLYRYHDGEYIEGMAKGEPEVSKDGLTWTFHLRDAKWSDGQPVKAQDFEYSWKRLADPKTGSQYSFLVTDYVQGAEEFFKGEATVDDVAIKALDDKTLEVKLVAPTPHFKQIITYGVFVPVRQDLVEEYGKDYAAEPKNMVFNGPWKLVRWDHNSELEFEPNENYWNKKAVKLDKVITPIVEDTSAAVNMYETGELDMVGLSGEFAVQYEKEGKAKYYEDGATAYLQLNQEKYQPFQNAKIRKAFALAIDRENYISTVFKLPYEPATNFVNPVLKGNEKTFREEYPGDYFPVHDADEAKKLLKEGMKELGIDKLPKLELLIDDGELSRASGEFLQENFRNALGVEAVLSPVPFNTRLDRSKNGEYQAVLSLWGPDYDDPMTFMDMWVSDGPFNEVHYSNEKYDNCIKEAKNSNDNAKRMELMAQAEEQLMEDLPIIPLYHRTRGYAINDDIVGLSRTAFSPDIDWMFADIKATK